MTMLRDVRTPYRDFAFGIQALTHFLLWQALTEAGMVVVEVPGYSGPVAGRQLAGNVAGVAILRAGLGMIGPVRQLIPPAPSTRSGSGGTKRRSSPLSTPPTCRRLSTKCSTC